MAAAAIARLSCGSRGRARGGGGRQRLWAGDERTRWLLFAVAGARAKQSHANERRQQEETDSWRSERLPLDDDAEIGSKGNDIKQARILACANTQQCIECWIEPKCILKC